MGPHSLPEVALDGRLGELLAEQPQLVVDEQPVVQRFLAELSSNPLYYRLLIDDELRLLREQLPEVAVESHFREGMQAHSEHLERWVTDPSFRVDDPEQLQGLFRLLGFTVAAREELFEPAGAVDLHDSSQALLVDVVVDGLFEE